MTILQWISDWWADRPPVPTSLLLAVAIIVLNIWLS
jgi:hypothetical protein